MSAALPGEWRVYAAVVPLAALGLWGAAFLQFYFVVGEPLVGRALIVPGVAGTLFGALIARVLVARNRERELHARLLRGTDLVERLNVDLEIRVVERSQQLAQAHAALMEAERQQLLGRMAGGLAHDFANLVSVIQLCSGSLREEIGDDLPDAARHALADLDAAAGNARNVCRELLTLARRQPAEPTEFDLQDLVTAQLPVLRRMLGANLRLTHGECTRGCPTQGRCRVRVNRTQMEQVLLNLTVNARDATPPGGECRIELCRAEHDVVLRVIDSGSGMEPEVVAHIFEPFYTTKGEGRGTGLGLSVVNEVVRQAGGSIAVDSKPGRGTVFEVRLPAIEGAPKAA